MIEKADIPRSDFIDGNPRPARWSFGDLVTLDGHRLNATFSCSLRVLPEPAERKLFSENFPKGAGSIDDITAHFSPPLHHASVELASHHTAEQALSDQHRLQWIEALRLAGETAAFSCGIELLAPFSLEMDSPTLQQERLSQMQRTVNERQTAGRMEHFQRAADLLAQWEKLRAGVPSIMPGNVLTQINPADQGAMLETLLMASGGQGAVPDLWAVAGPYLVRMDVRSEQPVTRLFPMPPVAGPLRSVQAVNGRILIGARKGVLVVDPANPEEPRVYLDVGFNSEHGFTRATFEQKNIWACHREGGLVGWNPDATDQPTHVFRPDKMGGPARLLLHADGTVPLIFAVQNQLLGLNADHTITRLMSFTSHIVGLCHHQNRLIVACEAGDISIYDGDSFEKTAEFFPVGKIAGAALLPWLSSARLLLTTPNGPLFCAGLDDPLITQYTGPVVGARSAVGSAGRVAAMSADRQRIILWNSWDGKRTAGEIHLAGQTHHRIADICFAI